MKIHAIRELSTLLSGNEWLLSCRYPQWRFQQPTQPPAPALIRSVSRRNASGREEEALVMRGTGAFGASDREKEAL